jgi:hypothetical protein
MNDKDTRPMSNRGEWLAGKIPRAIFLTGNATVETHQPTLSLTKVSTGGSAKIVLKQPLSAPSPPGKPQSGTDSGFSGHWTLPLPALSRRTRLFDEPNCPPDDWRHAHPAVPSKGDSGSYQNQGTQHKETLNHHAGAPSLPCVTERLCRILADKFRATLLLSGKGKVQATELASRDHRRFPDVVS